MSKLIFTLGMSFFLAGCTSFGSLAWQNQHMKKIEKEYDDKTVTTKEYICLKNETERLRFNDTPRPSSRLFACRGR